jgi:hypothetical protein
MVFHDRECLAAAAPHGHGHAPVNRISRRTSSAAQGSSNIVGQNTLYQTLLAYSAGRVWTLAVLRVMVVVRSVCFLVVVPGCRIGL